MSARFPHTLRAGVLVVAGCGAEPSRVPVGPPITALITVDTWRHSHFSPEFSPKLYALASEGERFDNAWSPIGLTSPSHATMLTGLMPWQHGMEANNHHGYTLSPTVPHILDDPTWQALPKGAFTSAYPAGPEGGLSRGFDVFDGPESGERAGAETVERALAWLPEGKSAFLWVHVYEPHGPYEGSGQSDVERYGGEVRRADAILAPLIDVLVARGSTIVVAGDHGEVLLEERCGRQHERSISPHVLHVPLFRWTPSRPGRVSSDLVGLEDVPALLRGADPTPQTVRFAESGLCEPGCNPGCRPKGVQGRDRVAFDGAGARAVLRAGTVTVTGRLDDDAVRQLLAIPPVSEPGEPDQASLEQLGYSEP